MESTLLEIFTPLVTGRTTSYFATDFAEHFPRIKVGLTGARVLVLGGAGSIGSSTVKWLSALPLAALHIVDHNENGLTELVRSLRSEGSIAPTHFKTLPIDINHPIFFQYLHSEKHFDWILNFAALKHVRSEKDIFSLLQMLQTNVLTGFALRKWLAKYAPSTRYFAVSSDKAANPTSAMGATKRLMEDITFYHACHAVSARFANVAFSNGSLLQSWLYRLEQKQVLPVPVGVSRYFVSLEESGHICTMAAFLAPSHHIVYPTFAGTENLHDLEKVLLAILNKLKIKPVFFTDEVKAKEALPKLIAKGEWAVLRTPMDTTGEKSFEEFYTEDEPCVDLPFASLAAVKAPLVSPRVVDLCNWLTHQITVGDLQLKKEVIIERLMEYLPTFKHRETGVLLDERI